MLTMNMFRKLRKTNGQRHAVLPRRNMLWKKRAMRALTHTRVRSAGRTNTGRIACRTKGAKDSARMRIVNHPTLIHNVPGYTTRLEYDPYRSAFITMISYSHGLSTYVLASHGVTVGERVVSYPSIISSHIYGAMAITLHRGDSCTMEHMPPNTTVYGLERHPDCGGSLARSSGTYCMEIRKYNGIRRCLVKLPSKQLFSISLGCFGARGIASNKLHYRHRDGKAGRARNSGSHPIVRGVAKNPVDHPHGGGEGKKSKKCFPRTAWGRLLKWRRTGVSFFEKRIRYEP